VVPTLVEVMVSRKPHHAPQSMNKALAQALKKFGPNSEIGKELAKGFGTAVAETEVLAGARAREGKYNLNDAIWRPCDGPGDRPAAHRPAGRTRTCTNSTTTS
jgi:hypothetical protein